jgi:DsbC/DsbD-like thiol-disulfide interchange protein
MAAPSAAGDRFETPVTAEVLEGWVQQDGSRMAGLRLQLAPGWKTYWRAPGDAGIPPRFDWSGSRNMSTVAVTWPTPKVFDQNGMRSIGYSDTLVIPLRIEPAEGSKPVRLKAEMELGVCSDVCVPYELNFDALIDEEERKPTPAIAAALAQQPYTAQEAGVRSTRCTISPTPDGVQVEARITMPSAGNPEHVVIEPGPGNLWVSEAKTRRHGDAVVAISEMVNVNGGPIALDRSSIRITVLGSKHAVDIRGCSAG